MTRVVACSAACALALNFIPAAAQNGIPLTSQASIVTRPDGSVERAVEWVDAVLTHVPGVSDEPTKIVGAWKQAVVTNLLAEVASIRRLMQDPRTKVFPLPIELDRGRRKEIRYSSSERKALDEAASRALRMGLSDADLVARSIVLHSDIAILGDGTGQILWYADGQPLNLVVRPADHWAAARTLADTLDTRAGRHVDIAAWYRATLAHMASIQTWNATHAERALARFSDDPELQFLVGCLHETLAAPRTQSAVANRRLTSGFVVRVRSAQGELDQAASLLKRALVLNPQHTETRVHYGRVLTLTGRAETAVSELRRAVGDATEPVQQYHAQLLLGAVLESTNQRDEARAAYQAAATLFPRAQAPRLALSQLSFSLGDRVEAAEAIAPARAPGRRGPEAGPLVELLRIVWRWCRESTGGGAATAGDAAGRRDAMRHRWLALVLVEIVGIVALSAGVRPSRAQQPTFSTRRETVRVDVLVSDRGRPVRGLDVNDFEILDSGIPQQVELVSFEQLPLAVVLALDGSASISTEALDNLRTGGRAVLANLRSDDQAALLTFADAVTLRERLTEAADRVDSAALDQLEPSRELLSGTALIDACYTAMTVLDGVPGRGLLIVFTDGVDTSSWLPAESVLQAGRRSNAVVYAVSTSPLPRRSFLRDLSDVTGGGAVEIPSTENVSAAFVRILDEFRQRYVVAFSPTNVPGAGWHALTVRVKNRKLDVKARPGYAR